MLALSRLQHLGHEIDAARTMNQDKCSYFLARYSELDDAALAQLCQEANENKLVDEAVAALSTVLDKQGKNREALLARFRDIIEESRRKPQLDTPLIHRRFRALTTSFLSLIGSFVAVVVLTNQYRAQADWLIGLLFGFAGLSLIAFYCCVGFLAASLRRNWLVWVAPTILFSPIAIVVVYLILLDKATAALKANREMVAESARPD